MRTKSEHYPLVEAELDRVTAELDKARNTLAILDGTQDRSETQRVLDWWLSARGTLVTLVPATFANPRVVDDSHPDDPQLGDDDDRDIDEDGFWVGGSLIGVDFVPAVEGESSVACGVLKKLNTKVVLSFTPNGKRYHKLERGILTADFGEHLLTLNGNTRR